MSDIWTVFWLRVEKKYEEGLRIKFLRGGKYLFFEKMGFWRNFIQVTFIIFVNVDSDYHYNGSVNKKSGLKLWNLGEKLYLTLFSAQIFIQLLNDITRPKSTLIHLILLIFSKIPVRLSQALTIRTCSSILISPVHSHNIQILSLILYLLFKIGNRAHHVAVQLENL